MPKLGTSPRFGKDGVSRQIARQRHRLKTGAARIELRSGRFFISDDFPKRSLQRTHAISWRKQQRSTNQAASTKALFAQLFVEHRRRRTEAVHYSNWVSDARLPQAAARNELPERSAYPLPHPSQYTNQSAGMPAAGREEKASEKMNFVGR